MRTSLGNVHINGASGQSYLFHAFALDTVFDQVGAVYFITSRNALKDGRVAHSRIYCGETANLSSQSWNKEQAASFKSHGANCICIFLSEDAQLRHTVEEDIHSNYRLLCKE